MPKENLVISKRNLVLTAYGKTKTSTLVTSCFHDKSKIYCANFYA